MFPDRWSPRAFDPSPISAWQVEALFEAARWAPSCMNEQPWRFRYAVTPEARARVVDTLTPRNQEWARLAPLLAFATCRTTFSKNDRPNRHAGFDTGAAWMALALQARRLGLHAHAMAGFDLEKARALLGLPDSGWDVLCCIAVGRRGDAEALPEHHRNGEHPNDRQDPVEVALPL
jgi:nitroreductase